MAKVHVCLLSLLTTSCILYLSCEGQEVSTIVDVTSGIRLVGGINQYEGRVEVYRSGEWQTVCDNSWDIKEAEVVCRQLGYGYAIMAIDGAAFGQGSGGQWNRDWSCSGREDSLDSCPSTSISCSHKKDASVICSNSALNKGAMRMVNTGITKFGGRLEFYYNGTWGTVCDDGWGINEAEVACRQMGFLGVSNSDSSLFGPGVSSQTIWLDDVMCHGSESRLIDCGHAAIGQSNCKHSEDVGIVCTNVGEASDIRLVNGRNQYEGRVEVYRHRQWQTVCDDSWGIKEAEVVCRQLGYGYAIMAIDGAAFGQGSNGQWSRVWSCNGNEGSLHSCRSGSASCSHAEDASVVCSSSALSNGALRMVNTRSTKFGGRLEFYYNREWGTVCDIGWSPEDATVACRQLGFLGVSDSDSSLFGPGPSSQTIWLADVACSGSESRLINCNYAAIDVGNDICEHNEDVGIVCNTNAPQVNVAAIAGGVVTGVVVLCIVAVAVWVCVCVCCYRESKKARSQTDTSPPQETTVSQAAAQEEQQQGIKPPQYNPLYDPTLQGAYASKPAPFPEPTAPAVGGALPPTHAGPAGYPSQPSADLPPPYPGTPSFTDPK